MHHVVIASGFTQQKWAKHGNGSIRIYREIRELLGEVSNVEFSLLEWHEDPKGYARFIAENTKPEDKILIAGYSYGGGWWARVCLKYLKKYAPHTMVNAVILCDPVFRHPLWLLNWLSLFRRTVNIAFGNVQKLFHLLQKKNKPGNNHLVFDEDTEYIGPIELDCSHVKIDNSDEYRQTVLDAAREVFLVE